MLAAGSQPVRSANEDKPFDHILFYEPLFSREDFFFRVHGPAEEKLTALQLLLAGQYRLANTSEAKPGPGASTSKRTAGRREQPHRTDRKLFIH